MDAAERDQRIRIRNDKKRIAKDVQTGVFVANMLGDKERVKALLDQGSKAANVGMNIAGGNNIGAITEGIQLGKQVFDETKRNLPMISKEMKKIDEWNKSHDEYGRKIEAFLI